MMAQNLEWCMAVKIIYQCVFCTHKVGSVCDKITIVGSYIVLQSSELEPCFHIYHKITITVFILVCSIIT